MLLFSQVDIQKTKWVKVCPEDKPPCWTCCHALSFWNTFNPYDFLIFIKEIQSVHAVHWSIRSLVLEEKSVTAGRTEREGFPKSLIRNQLCPLCSLDLRLGHSRYNQLLPIWPESNTSFQQIWCRWLIIGCCKDENFQELEYICVYFSQKGRGMKYILLWFLLRE